MAQARVAMQIEIICGLSCDQHTFLTIIMCASYIILMLQSVIDLCDELHHYVIM